MKRQDPQQFHASSQDDTDPASLQASANADAARDFLAGKTTDFCPGSTDWGDEVYH